MTSAIGKEVEKLVELLPEVIFQRSMRDRVTVRPLRGFVREEPMQAANADVEELLASDAGRQCFAAYAQGVGDTMASLLCDTVLVSSAMTMRAVIESERDKRIQRQTRILKIIISASIAVSVIILLYRELAV